MTGLVINDRRHHAKAANLLAEHPIPPITDPLGHGWCQPSRLRIEIDATHALMSQATFEELKEYSGTVPTGVYAGKMWKRHDGLFDRRWRAAGGKPVWMLCWYGLSDRGPGWCTTNYRLILLISGELPEATP